MGKPLIIGLCGAAGSGKSTVAAWLQNNYGFARVRFADPLKRMLREFYRSAGVVGDDIDRRIEGDLKEVPCQYLGGNTPRYAMQTLGTEWGRDTMAVNLWTNAWQAAALKRVREGAPGVVAEDVRFPNEEVALRVAGGVLVRVLRPLAEHVAMAHSSETQPLSPDYTVRNDGTADMLGPELQGLLADMGHSL